MNTVRSQDGTSIAFERSGRGPALILVDGALCYRAQGPSRPLAAALADRFTVYIYDRRGRGESGDTPPFAIAREVEDLAALIAEAGGSALVYGISSGAALALEAANAGLPITKLALYEAPFVVDDTHPPFADDFLLEMKTHVAHNRRGDAVRLFLRAVGLPAVALVIMRFLPVWSKLTGVAHTLPYDLTITHEHQQGRPFRPERWAGVTAPTLVADGGKSPEWMRNATRALAQATPHGTYRTLPGQNHMVSAKALAPVLAEFFSGT
jgi:pimeloyl-ACP methyl ester carboxylesterase